MEDSARRRNPFRCTVFLRGWVSYTQRQRMTETKRLVDDDLGGDVTVSRRRSSPSRSLYARSHCLEKIYLGRHV